jgi:hypothetical protein
LRLSYFGRFFFSNLGRYTCTASSACTRLQRHTAGLRPQRPSHDETQTLQRYSHHARMPWVRLSHDACVRVNCFIARKQALQILLFERASGPRRPSAQHALVRARIAPRIFNQRALSSTQQCSSFIDSSDGPVLLACSQALQDLLFERASAHNVAAGHSKNALGTRADSTTYFQPTRALSSTQQCSSFIDSSDGPVLFACLVFACLCGCDAPTLWSCQTKCQSSGTRVRLQKNQIVTRDKPPASC